MPLPVSGGAFWRGVQFHASALKASGGGFERRRVSITSHARPSMLQIVKRLQAELWRICNLESEARVP